MEKKAEVKEAFVSKSSIAGSVWTGTDRGASKDGVVKVKGLTVIVDFSYYTKGLSEEQVERLAPVFNKAGNGIIISPLQNKWKSDKYLSDNGIKDNMTLKFSAECILGKGGFAVATPKSVSKGMDDLPAKDRLNLMRERLRADGASEDVINQIYPIPESSVKAETKKA